MSWKKNKNCLCLGKKKKRCFKKKRREKMTSHHKQQVCLLSVLENIKHRKWNPTSTSRSMVLYGDYNRKPVVLKLAPAGEKEDNGLELEREMYMYMNKMKVWTPHFAYGLDIGACDFESIKSIEQKWVEQFIQDWELVCYNFFERERHEFEQRYPQASVHDVFEFLLYNHIGDKIHFVMMPEDGSQSLSRFLDFQNQQLWDTPPQELEDFDFVIAMQVAQALCAAKKLPFIHNDLHLGNILIKTYEEKKDLHYHYPFDFTLHTRYEIIIFDYDRAYIPAVGENTSLTNYDCEPFGMCNQYKEWFDWDTFLNHYVHKVEPFRETPLIRMLRGGNRGEYDPLKGKKIGERAYFGRACVCNVDGEGKRPCASCTPEERMKVKWTPCEFLFHYRK
jgi:hypothetical protein